MTTGEIVLAIVVVVVNGFIVWRLVGDDRPRR